MSRMLRAVPSKLGLLSAALFLAGVADVPAASAATVAAGAGHTLVINTRDGILWVWGANGSGQLGDGTIGAPLPIRERVVARTAVFAVAAGAGHSLALTRDGTLWGWGGNAFGQVGDGSNEDQPLPIAIMADVTAVAAGDNHSVARKVDGSVWTWGANADGQLGDGGTGARNRPALVPNTGLVSAIGAGATHTIVVLQAGGKLKAWGRNANGQLGDGAAYAVAAVPVTVPGLTDIVVARAGNAFTGALRLGATVYVWGDNSSGQLGLGDYTDRPTPTLLPTLTAISGIAAGAEHMLAVSGDGNVQAWGNNAYGAVGDGTTISRPAPVAVAGLPAIAAIAAGADYSVAVAASGEVWTWGRNQSGQLGDATTDTRLSPVQIADAGYKWKAASPAPSQESAVAQPAKPDVEPSAISSGTFSLTDEGSVAAPSFSPSLRRSSARVALGATSATEGATVQITTDGAEPTTADPVLGPGQTITVDRAQVIRAKAWKDPLPPSATTSAFIAVTGALASGEDHILALAADGTVSAWGYNYYGQLGNGGTGYSVAPVPVPTLSGIVAVAAGSGHSLALDGAGRVWAWGNNYYGQLGDGNSGTIRTTPQLVPGLSGVAAIAAGRLCSFAVMADGSAYGWGDNTFGKLGDGTSTNRNSPTRILNLAQVVSIAAGGYHTLAVTADGLAWSWGANYYGQLGDGTTTDRWQPGVVAGLTGVRQVAAGGSFSLALKTDGLESGAVWTWGGGVEGELGNGILFSFVRSPARVLEGVLAIAAGEKHSLALKLNGQTVAWGQGTGSYGRLGDGARTNRPSPVVVSAPDAVVLSAGNYHSAAIHADGSVSTWGYYGPAGSDLPRMVPGLTLVSNQWLRSDEDGDALTAWDEWRYGCDPYLADTNGDGVRDDVAVALGRPCASLDTDGDGILDSEEKSAGTDPTRADTDGDGVPDGLDCAPLDPTRSACTPVPGDTTPPVITLQEPPNATPIQ